jgi:hypothetical protein
MTAGFVTKVLLMVHPLSIHSWDDVRWSRRCAEICASVALITFKPNMFRFVSDNPVNPGHTRYVLNNARLDAGWWDFMHRTTDRPTSNRLMVKTCFLSGIVITRSSSSRFNAVSFAKLRSSALHQWTLPNPVYAQSHVRKSLLKPWVSTFTPALNLRSEVKVHLPIPTISRIRWNT